MKSHPPQSPRFALAALLLVNGTASAATMSASADPPLVSGVDIANYETATGTDKWWNDAATSGRPKGQTFSTGDVGVLLKSITFQVGPSHQAMPTKGYVIRVGTISGTEFTEIHSETATQDFEWTAGQFMTWTFDSPVSLLANSEYGVDVGMTTSTSSWQSGIPNLSRTGDEYAGGSRYMSGTSGSGLGDSTMNNVSGDMIFHLDLEHPLSPSPESGAVIPAGDVELSWTNLSPNTGADVWVDVWFGTDLNSLTQVLIGGLNVTSQTVNVPGGGTYYWRVDSYLDGSFGGNPTVSSLFDFQVIDSDGDGFPDVYEMQITQTNTGLNRDDDLENDGAGDGLTNWEEYELGTNPLLADSDGDGLDDGPETTGVGQRPATDPTKGDTDGDGLTDGVESNSGTWMGLSDTGTNPASPDTDGDGLNDRVENNTGEFVDAEMSGTNPLNADSDNDGAEDWYEIAATFTDPTDPESNPGIPYPLPDPDGSTGAADKPVKVYILSGQSNMVGFGRLNGDEAGTLETMTGVENKFPNLIDDSSGEWSVRNDVQYRGVISDIGSGALSPDVAGTSFGPELGFGYVMGWYHDEPVLLIKSSIGNRSLSWDCLPPGSGRVEFNGNTYAGYGESPTNWAAGGGPSPFVWYAGKQYDDYFLDEADMGPMVWASGLAYPGNCQVSHNGATYISNVEHTSSAAAEPGIGSEWNVYSVFNVVDILDNFASEYPEYADQGFEISGYVWWQGHKDQGEPAASSYEGNMVNFIKAIRGYYEDRYPENTVSDAPFVLATIAFDGWDLSGAGLTVAEGQLAVDGDTGNYPEFSGNVKTVEARSYWRDSGPSTQGFHYNHHAETYMLAGDALARAMVELQGLPSGGALAITSLTLVGSDEWEVIFTGRPETAYQFLSDTTLNFSPGTFVSGLTQGNPGGDPGTIGGPNNSVITTDASGNATLRLGLGGGMKGFLRAQVAE